MEGQDEVGRQKLFPIPIILFQPAMGETADETPSGFRLSLAELLATALVRPFTALNRAATRTCAPAFSLPHLFPHGECRELTKPQVHTDKESRQTGL